MKKLILTLAIIVLLAGCVSTDKARDVISNMQDKFNEMKDYECYYKVITETNETKKIERYYMVFKKPNKFLIEMNNLTIISNGEKEWIYDKSKNEVIVRNATIIPIPTFTEFIQNILNYYEPELIGEEKVIGKECYVIKLKPKYTSPNATMWISKDYLPVKIVMDFDGAKSTTIFESFKINTGISDDFFKFKPPEGAKIKYG